MSIEIRKDTKGNTTWRARDGEDSRDFASAKGFKKKDAAEWLNEVRYQKRKGTYVERRRGQVTVEQYAQTWLATLTLSPRSRTVVESRFRNHVYPTALGASYMNEVFFSDFAGWVANRAQVMAPRSLNSTKGYLARMFTAAVRDRVIGESPCTGVKGLKVARESTEAMSDNELEEIWGDLPRRWRDIVPVGKKSGLRQSELRGLRVNRVDFLRRTIKVDCQLQDGEFCPPKYGSYRTVIVDQETVDIIAAHLARWGQGPHGLVFTSAEGLPLSMWALTQGWKRAARKAGVRDGTTPHDMRHHYASVMLEAGTPVEIVAAQLGHSDPSITYRVYSHLIKGNEDKRRAIIEAALLSMSPKSAPKHYPEKAKKGL